MLTLKQAAAQTQHILASLPESSDGIAKMLAREQVTGMPKPYCCPLANYLRKHLDAGENIAIWVSPNHVELSEFDSNSIRSLDWDILLPGPCRAFVLNFDSGLYPELVDKA